MSTIEELKSLADENKTDALEEAWVAYAEQPDADWLGLTEVIEKVASNGQAEMAEVLAWTALSGAGDDIDPHALLPFASAVLQRFEENEDVRGAVVNLYKQVYAETTGAEELLNRSGLADGSKSVRRALRLLEICLTLEPGHYLLERGGESVAKVTARADDRTTFTIHTDGRTRDLTAERLAVDYQHVDQDDFRVLSAFRPERLTEAVEKEPLVIITGVLRAHGDRIDADSLKFLLCPKYLANDAWSKWWTRARNAIKRSGNVKTSGRSPIMLTYDPKGHSLEDDAQAAFDKAADAAAVREAVDSYFREVKHQNARIDAAFVKRLAAGVRKRVEATRRFQPAEALCLALVLRQSLAPHTKQTEDEQLAAEVLVQTERPEQVLIDLPDSRQLTTALTAVRDAFDGTWADIYARFLPDAPLATCGKIADALIEADHVDRVKEVVTRVVEQPRAGICAYGWLWTVPERAAELGAPPPRTLLGQILGLLGDIEWSDIISREEGNRIKIVLRAALNANQQRVFRAVVDDIEPGLALTFRRQVRRLDGLGPALRDRLDSILSPKCPVPEAAPQIAPWDDVSVIYTTADGLKKISRELEQIVSVKMKENAVAIGEAAARGDLSENSEYKFALEERDLLRARAANMTQQIEKASVIDLAHVDTDRVTIGTRVTLRAEDGDATHKVTILGPWEADLDQGVYNYQAPLCKNLLGRRVGEKTVVNIDGVETPCMVTAITTTL